MKFFRMTVCATAIAFSALFLAVYFSSASANHNSPASLEARIAAVGTLQIGVAAAVANDSDSDSDSDSDTPEDGETVYNATCATCHTSGIAGAPVLGKVADWEKRIEQGIAVLREHAIQGFTGSLGVMPAKGGNPSLSDDAVTAAVNFMVDRVE